MRLAEVQRRVRDVQNAREKSSVAWRRASEDGARILYRDTLRTLLDHDLPDDARQIIEAALEAER